MTHWETETEQYPFILVISTPIHFKWNSLSRKIFQLSFKIRIQEPNQRYSKKLYKWNTKKSGAQLNREDFSAQLIRKIIKKYVNQMLTNTWSGFLGPLTYGSRFLHCIENGHATRQFPQTPRTISYGLYVNKPKPSTYYFTRTTWVNSNTTAQAKRQQKISS